MLITRFVHFLGMCLWIGGAFAAMIVAFGVRGEAAAVKATAFRLLSRIHGLITGPGALVTVGTGLLMTMQLSGQGAGVVLQRPGLWIMQGAGLLAGIIWLFGTLPTATKLAGVAVVSDDGELPPIFEKLRKRQAVLSSVAGVLALVALFTGVVVR